MREYSVSDLALMLGSLESICRELEIADQIGKTICTEEFSSTLCHVLDGSRIACANFDADPALIEQLRILGATHLAGDADRREGVLAAQIRSILSGIENNLGNRQFLLLSAEEAQHYKNLKIFGDSFSKNYPLNAARDAVEVGNCYAASCYTACVFHCMRVAEYGLRKLAANRMLRVKITKKGKP